RQPEATSLALEPAAAGEEVSWREVRQVLDEEIARLPADLRSAMIHCLFEGRTQEEAAQFLEVNPRTLKARLARGRELLRRRLTRGGVGLAVRGAVLSGSGARAALPPVLLQGTLQGATALVNKAVLTGVISPAVLALTGSTSILTGWGLVVAAVVGLALSSGT